MVRPLYVCCHKGTKKPIGYDWGKSGFDEAELAKRLAINPDLVVGLILGQLTQLIDVECDGPEASADYQQLFGDIESPTWVSLRGKHQLFKYDPRLAELPSTVKLPSGLEFRVGNDGQTQSVCPPSTVDGVKREWIIPLEECDPPALPEHVIELLLSLPKDSKANSRIDTSAEPASAQLIQQAIEYVRAADTGLKDGRRNAAFRLAGHLFAFVDEDTGARLSERQILDLMRPWNILHDPPLAEDVLIEKIHNAVTYSPRPDKVIEQPVDLDELLGIKQEVTTPNIFKFKELRTNYPTLNLPVVDGLIREGETCNIISYSKIGKSWLAYGLTLSVITGQPWLDKFSTASGEVLYIDNELHRNSLANRIPAVADAMGISADAYENQLEIWPLRGRLRSLNQLGPDFARIERGQFKLIVLDAAYRFHLDGVSENDNAEMARFYNSLDRIAEHTGAAIVLVHHTSKGNQSGKRVTDVGAGAGSQSRAADCHLVLREHETEGVVVLDAAVRSFKPVQPMSLQWEWPLWKPVDADPARLKTQASQGAKRQEANDLESIDAISAALREGPKTVTQLRKTTGFGQNRVERVIGIMARGKLVTSDRTTVQGRQCDQYRLAC